MSWLTPIFLWTGLLAIPILVLYMLRLRRPERRVSSTWLWQRLVRDREANAPWQKLRRNLLLLVQLLILALLVLALARPYLPTGRLAQGSVVVLLDASASMLATDVAPSHRESQHRFAAAQAIVEEMIGDLAGNDQMTLILIGRTPQVLAAATADKALLRQALANASPTQGEADWEAAYALAAGAAQGFADPQLVVVSDGGAPAPTAPLPVQPRYVPVGVADANLALAALATHVEPEATTLLARVVNYGSQTQSAVLTLQLSGALFDARRLTLAPDESASLVWELPPTPEVIEASLTSDGPDYLAVDNVAWAAPAGALSHRVLLVTAGNIFLEQVLGVMPGVELFKAAPDAPLETDYDLYVFDGVLWPDPAPAGPYLIFNPPASHPPLTVGGLFTNTLTTRLADSPLLQFVDWGGVHVQQAREVQAPWAQTLIGAEGGPLVLAGEWQGRRVAIFTFDVRDSDLPLQITFPILMANLTTWLNPGQLTTGETALSPGQPVMLQPGAGVTEVRVVRPDGVAWEQSVEAASLVFDDTGQPGVYTLWVRDALGERPAGLFTVNLFSERESRLAPAATLPTGPSGGVAAAEAQVGQQELWPWLLGLALAGLVVEWWLYQRGPVWPRRRLPLGDNKAPGA